MRRLRAVIPPLTIVDPKITYSVGHLNPVVQLKLCGILNNLNLPNHLSNPIPSTRALLRPLLSRRAKVTNQNPSHHYSISIRIPTVPRNRPRFDTCHLSASSSSESNNKQLKADASQSLVKSVRSWPTKLMDACPCTHPTLPLNQQANSQGRQSNIDTTNYHLANSHHQPTSQLAKPRPFNRQPSPDPLEKRNATKRNRSRDAGPDCVSGGILRQTTEKCPQNRFCALARTPQRTTTTDFLNITCTTARAARARMRASDVSAQKGA
ncbi:hypothetical protein IWX90DRAFT_106162 [Phyllosticta citrichinensis]|uniref:Uncharacterized protein n=1 Tax=Phyllosticta citrichinensis TaxID=1130410 RepID=A0ABR1Y2A0_9PEZI